MDNIDVKTCQYPLNWDAAGRVKIWTFDPATGGKTLVLDKQNLIVKQGASILAGALAGQANSAITHFYVGYNTNPSFTPDDPAVTDTKNSFSSDSGAGYGYLKLALAFPPSFLSEETYSQNVPYFTTFITAASGSNRVAGAAFGAGVKIYTIGLINAQSSGTSQDRLFSRITFTPITFSDTNGLAITWGITFRAEDIAQPS